MDLRKIAIVTTSRGDRWPLDSIIRAFYASNEIDLVLLVGGALSIENPKSRELRFFEEWPEIVIHDIGGFAQTLSPFGIAKAIGEMLPTLTETLSMVRPDILIILGDRTEMLAVATAASLCSIPIAHIHGGEKSEGSTDDATRHALTLLSHLHFCSSKGSFQRIAQLGVNPERIYVTGAPSLDRFRESKSTESIENLSKQLNFSLVRPVALMTYHPPTLDLENIHIELEAIIQACSKLGSVIVTLPGIDPKSDQIRARLTEWEQSSNNIKAFESLGTIYGEVLSNVDFMIGNSSSGIVEAGFLGIP
ncbi:MAG: UDP-N-acetylglucosamine 2-epimerase (hydrolyzing), partial [Acidimicrobiales bacterium]|nr:UDP-N-acetylglucosamine 2-epimerase (hydrolyzing) [Acidimicrobiales bacterium]